MSENKTDSDEVRYINAADYNSINDLISAAKNAFGDKGIDKMAYFGHSNQQELSPFYGRSEIPNRWIDSGTDWSGVKFNENSSIFLFGCNAAKGENSIAQILANKTGANTYGYTSYSFFTNDRKLSNFERRPTNADITEKVPQSKEIWLVPNNGRPMKRLTNTK